jgi:hypothetical protein
MHLILHQEVVNMNHNKRAENSLKCAKRDDLYRQERETEKSIDRDERYLRRYRLSSPVSATAALVFGGIGVIGGYMDKPEAAIAYTALDIINAFSAGCVIKQIVYKSDQIKEAREKLEQIREDPEYGELDLIE